MGRYCLTFAMLYFFVRVLFYDGYSLRGGLSQRGRSLGLMTDIFPETI